MWYSNHYTILPQHICLNWSISLGSLNPWKYSLLSQTSSSHFCRKLILSVSYSDSNSWMITGTNAHKRLMYKIGMPAQSFTLRNLIAEQTWYSCWPDQHTVPFSKLHGKFNYQKVVWWACSLNKENCMSRMSNGIRLWKPVVNRTEPHTNSTSCCNLECLNRLNFLIVTVLLFRYIINSISLYSRLSGLGGSIPGTIS